MLNLNFCANTIANGGDYGFFKKYCPVWVYDCVVAQSVSDFILFGVDLAQPCRKFAGGLTEVFEEVSLEELVRASELVVQFLIEEKINEGSTDLLSNFSYYRFHYASKKIAGNLAVFLVQNYLMSFESIAAMKH